MQKLSPRLILFVGLFSIGITSLAQDCTCAISFEATVDTYEKNYSLFKIKVTESNLANYNAFTEVMREQAEQTKGLKECKLVLEQWLGFFRDKHNFIKLSIKNDEDFERVPVTEEQFKVNFQELGYQEEEIPGIWKWQEFKVAILPDPQPGKRPRDFVGVFLKSPQNPWKPGEVIMELTRSLEDELEVSFFMPDHSEMVLAGRKISAGQLNVKGLGEWQKIWPVAEIDEDRKLFNSFHIRMIDDIPYVRFPDFNVDPQTVEKALNANHEQLVNADFIIIDVRDNEGGSDYAYFPILPYILSGPVQIPHVGLWMSEDNLQPYLEKKGGKGKKPEDRTPKEKEYYDFIMSYQDSFFYQTPNEFAYTYKTDTLFKGPKKVAVLMNENTGSAGETFIFRGKQSDRVVFYGQNSGGYVDGFMVTSKNIGCFELNYPHAIRAKDIADNPIDPYGLEPDVYLDTNMDVLDFSIRHMRHLIKNGETKGNKRLRTSEH